MKKKVLRTAKTLGLKITQDHFKKYKIDNLKINGNQWVIEEQELDRWLVSINKVPNAVLNSKAVLKILKMATKS